MGQGRVFQTALGHEHHLYKHPFFVKHLEGGILWAGKRK
ncbi:ThuA domain-containing protein [Geofilum rubicundum]|nr:ThuA domain-containing protein [Geofilum rubicundum]